MRTERFLILAVILVLALAACGGPEGGAVQEINTATPGPTATPEVVDAATPQPDTGGNVTPTEETEAMDAQGDAATSLPQPTPGPLSPPLVGTVDFPGEPLPASAIPTELLDKVTADLQQRFSISRESIRVSRFDAILWNDGSMGCPQPGQFYTQALVEGYWLILQADGVSYDYRASKKGYFFLCEQRLPGEIRATAIPLQPVLVVPTTSP
jgi:hypothetical protein